MKEGASTTNAKFSQSQKADLCCKKATLCVETSNA